MNFGLSVARRARKYFLVRLELPEAPPKPCLLTPLRQDAADQEGHSARGETQEGGKRQDAGAESNFHVSHVENEVAPGYVDVGFDVRSPTPAPPAPFVCLFAAILVDGPRVGATRADEALVAGIPVAASLAVEVRVAEAPAVGFPDAGDRVAGAPAGEVPADETPAAEFLVGAALFGVAPVGAARAAVSLADALPAVVFPVVVSLAAAAAALAILFLDRIPSATLAPAVAVAPSLYLGLARDLFQRLLTPTMFAAVAVQSLCLRLGGESWEGVSDGSGGRWKSVGAEGQVPLSKDELEMLVPEQADYLRNDRLPGLSKMDL